MILLSHFFEGSTCPSICQTFSSSTSECKTQMFIVKTHLSVKFSFSIWNHSPLSQVAPIKVIVHIPYLVGEKYRIFFFSLNKLRQKLFSPFNHHPLYFIFSQRGVGVLIFFLYFLESLVEFFLIYFFVDRFIQEILFILYCQEHFDDLDIFHIFMVNIIHELNVRVDGMLLVSNFSLNMKYFFIILFPLK